MRAELSVLALVGSTALAQVGPGVATAVRDPAHRPRLIVAIAIDQFRADFLTRYADLFLPAQSGDTVGGFRYLTDRGAWFVNAQFEHMPLFTAPGHAVLLTGAHPNRSGIISNEWWDQRQQRVVYCVEDPAQKVVGAAAGSGARPMGPANLRSTTLGDELKLATGGRSKVVSIAVKDRASILMGGHVQDACLWFDSAGGRWISSTAFCPSGQLPAWVSALNDEQLPEHSLSQPWTPSLPAEVLQARTTVPGLTATYLSRTIGDRFPHRIVPEKKSDALYAFSHMTPFSNEFCFETARRAVTQEQLGQDETPDVLAISLSANDYIGHGFGVYSPEALDMTLRTDAALSGFLNFLAKAVPGGLSSVAIALSADHGSTPIPDDARQLGITAGRFAVKPILECIESTLNARFGPAPDGTWFSHGRLDPRRAGAYLDGFICLNPDAIAKAVNDGKAASRRDIERAACDAVNAAAFPGIYGLYGKSQILEGAIADPVLRDALAKGSHPALSPDFVLVPDQTFLLGPDPSGHATSHGAAYPCNSHVPVVLCCAGLIRAGTFSQPVSPADIAPTLSLLLGVEFPSGSQGRVLSEALAP